MRNRLRSLLLIAAAAAAQSPHQPPVPRTADGHPDLSGIWQGGSLSFAIGIENAKAAGQSAREATGTSAASVPQEPPPYQPWAEAKRKEYLERRGR